MKNIKIVIEYDGTAYHGWQVQPSVITIQEVLMVAIKKLAGENVVITGASRTDAGVHAKGQVANFLIDTKIPIKAFKEGLNSYLPHDVRIKEAELMAENFNSKRDAQQKRYEYFILISDNTPATFNKYFWHKRDDLNVDKMRSASELLVGTHDFSSFRDSGCDAKSPIREIYKAVVEEYSPHFLPIEGKILKFTFIGNAFLKQMIRNIVGTVVDVGLEKTTLDGFKEIFLAKDRTKAGITAPSRGLFLMEISY